MKKLLSIQFSVILLVFFLIHTMVVSAAEQIQSVIPPVIDWLIDYDHDDGQYITRKECIVTLMKMMGVSRKNAAQRGILWKTLMEHPDVDSIAFVNNGYLFLSEQWFLKPGDNEKDAGFHPERFVTVAEALSVMNWMLDGEDISVKVVWREISAEEEKEKAIKNGLITASEANGISEKKQMTRALFKKLVLRLMTMEIEHGEEPHRTYEERLLGNLEIWATPEMMQEGTASFIPALRSDVSAIRIGDFQTEKKSEVQYLSYLLSVLPINGIPITEEQELPIPVCIVYEDHSEASLFLSSHSIKLSDGKQYRIVDGAYTHLLEIIEGLANQQDVLPDVISFDTSSWAEGNERSEIKSVHLAIELGLLPRRYQVNYKEPITRLEICQILAHAFLEDSYADSATANTAFIDTNDPSIALLYDLGIVNGKTVTTFCPYDRLTREEFATLIYRLLCNGRDMIPTSPETIIEGYTDYADISEWAKDGINYLTWKNYQVGYGNGKFGPKDLLTKEQAIMILMVAWIYR